MRMSTLAEDYLSGRGGSVYEFHYELGQGISLGTAFFVSLSGTDQDRLDNTKYDPSGFDAAIGKLKIHKAIEYLLDTEGEN